MRASLVQLFALHRKIYTDIVVDNLVTNVRKKAFGTVLDIEKAAIKCHGSHKGLALFFVGETDGIGLSFDRQCGIDRIALDRGDVQCGCWMRFYMKEITGF